MYQNKSTNYRNSVFDCKLAIVGKQDVFTYVTSVSVGRLTGVEVVGSAEVSPISEAVALKKKIHVCLQQSHWHSDLINAPYMYLKSILLVYF